MRVEDVKFAGSWCGLRKPAQRNDRRTCRSYCRKLQTTSVRRCIHGSYILKLIDTWSSWQLDLGRPQHFTKGDFRIYGQFMHYCLGVQLGLETWLTVLKALTASNSLNVILNCAMAKASVRDRKLLAGPRIRAEPDVATVRSLCKVL